MVTKTCSKTKTQLDSIGHFPVVVAIRKWYIIHVVDDQPAIMCLRVLNLQQLKRIKGAIVERMTD